MCIVFHKTFGHGNACLATLVEVVLLFYWFDGIFYKSKAPFTPSALRRVDATTFGLYLQVMYV